MINNKTVLGIILARGGSKRLPNKNILPLAGIPLIGWTINAGLNSKYIDELIVSSDSHDILNIAKQMGSKVQLRPNEFSTDESSSFSSVKYVIKSLKKNFEYIILLQPTSPFRNKNHIDESIELIISKKADGIISVCKEKHSSSLINILPENKDMSRFLKNIKKVGESKKRSDFFKLNGAIYLCKTKKLLEQETFFLKEKIFAYEMKRKYSIDIDIKLDFEFANYLAESRINEPSNNFT